MILEHLKWRYDGHPESNWLSIGFSRGDHSGFGAWQAFRVSDLERVAALCENNAEANIATTIGTGLNRSATHFKKSEINGTSLVWVDVDVRDESIRDRVLAKILTYRVEPSRVYFSGRGFHVYWKLKEFSTDIFSIDAALRGVFEDFKSLMAEFSSGLTVDPAVVEVSRLMRVPGTWNTRSGLQCEPMYVGDLTYDLKDLPSVVDRVERVDLHVDRVPLPEDIEERIKKVPDGDLIWAQIYSEETASKRAPRNKATGEIDRSGNDWFIACRLLANDFEPSLVASVLSNEDWFCGRRVSEDGFGYAERTVRNAMAVIEKERAEDITVWVYDEEKRKNKFSPNLAATSIVRHFNLRTYAGEIYRYVDDQYVRGLGEVVYTTLSNKLKDKLLPAHLRDTETFVKRIASVNTCEPDGSTWVGVKNGILNLRTRDLRESSSDLFVIHRLPVYFEPERDQKYEDKVIDYVASVVGMDNVLTVFEHLGAAITTEVFPWAAAMYFQGKRNSGKSELLYFIEALLGGENTCAIDPVNLTGDKDAYSALLPGHLANIFHDTNAEATLKEISKLKPLISGEEYTANAKYRDPVKVHSYATFILATNGVSFAKTIDSAWLKRLLIISCERTFSPDQPGYQPVVGRKLAQDPRILTAALNLALDGLDRLRENSSYTRTESIMTAQRQYQEAWDSVASWVMHCTSYEPESRIPMTTVKKEYRAYCAQEGKKPVNLSSFQSRIDELRSSDPTFRGYMIDDYLPGLSYRARQLINVKITTSFLEGAHSNGKIYIGV